MEDDFKDNDPVIDKEKLEEQYAEMTPMMITEFELKTFDDKMNKLLEGMKDIDWSKAMVAAHTLKGSSG